ncbi:MAG: DUF547 domain-containing protein [Rhodothermales bacterium]|nr:DUF547 domain-containing protein [Rhodothermales bacterium]MBO6778148.1 DUF547 domain-containing protein [Rhodothermales bacterium]
MAQKVPFDHQHALWGDVLRSRVRGGLVDYRGLKASPTQLQDYLKALGAVRRGQFAAWSKTERLAFWINAYNAFTLRLVVSHYPVGSIRDIGLLPRWAFLTPTVRLPGMRRVMNLLWLEHRILRSRFSEPRIHAAINCASMSCPELAPEPYQANRLEEQLEGAMLRFVRDPARNRLDRQGNVLYLSAIFDWFETDFPSPISGFVASCMEADDAAWIRTHHPAIKTLPYDWSLNAQDRLSA